MRNRKNGNIPAVGEVYENMDKRAGAAQIRILDVVSNRYACVQNVLTNRNGRISVHSFYNESATLSSGYRRVAVAS